MDAFSNVHKNFSDNVVRNLFIFFLFAFFIFTPYLKAGGEATLDLNVTLNILESAVEVGQPYTNNITIINKNPTNSGRVDAKNSEITYYLPTGSSYYSDTGSDWNCNHDDPAKIVCTYGADLNNSQTSKQLVLKIKAPNDVTTLKPICTVALEGTTDPYILDNNATDSIKTGKSNLTATKTASPDTLAYNQPFSYTISVSNPDASTTTVPARGVVIKDTLPPGFQLTSINTTGGLVCNESPTDTLTCNPIDLNVNDTKTVTIEAIASPSGNNLTNTANITATSSDYNAPLSPSKTVVVQLADIGITQSITSGVIAATNKVTVDSNVVYQYTVKNYGATTAKDINISSVIPTGATLVSTSGAWTCTTATPIGNTASPLKCNLNATDLAGGASSSLDVTLKMPSSVATLTSNATAYTSSTEENNHPNSTPALTTTVVGADLDIDKTQSSSSANIGENHDYTITVTNNGLVAANSVYVVDTLDLDQNMTYISDTSGGKCSLNGTIKTLTCNIGTIAAGDNYSFNVTVKMPTDSSAAVTNKVDVNTSTGQDNTNNLTDSIDTSLTIADLSIDKSRSQRDVGLGKTFYYTITVNNSNTATAYNPTITDILPDGVSITSISNNSDNWNCNVPASGGSTFTCTLPTGIFPNPSSTLQFNAVTSTTKTGWQKNTAKIGHSLNPTNDSHDAWIFIEKATLDITKEASPTAIVGGLIDYNITVDNTSISDANQTTITDDISAFNGNYEIDASSLPSGDWDCRSSTTTKLTCIKNSLLLAKTNDTINFKVKVPLDAPLGTVNNTASVDTITDSNTPLSSNPVPTTIKGASLVLSQVGDTSGIANKPISFNVEVLNDGTATAKDVNVTIDLNTNSAANFTNISVDCGSGSSSTSEPFTCTLNDIASGTSKNIIITATAPNYDSVYSDKNITNSVQAFTSTPQETTNTDNITWDTPISGADLFVQKTPSSPKVAVGETVTYTIALRNQGLADAAGITLNDSVLGGTPLVLSNLNAGAGWSCTTSFPSGFTCNYDSVLVKDTNTTIITVDATAPTNQAIINTKLKNKVIVSNSTAEVDISTTNKSVSPVTVRGADVTITKTVDHPIVTLGEQVVFTINVTNNDLADAQDVNVTDPLPAGFTYISTTCTNSTVNGLNFLCQLGTLTSGASKSFTITANAPSTDGTFNNIATTVTSTPESNTNNNEDNATVTVQGADLRITKRDSADPVAVNSLYNYTIHLENIGESSAFGADINDTISDKGWTYVKMVGTPATGWTCSEDSTKINCHTNSEIHKGYDKDIITFQVRAPSTIGLVYNTAIVDTNTSEADDITNNQNNTDTESTLVMAINLQARKLVNENVSGINFWSTNPTYVGIGDDINYTLQVRNEEIHNDDGNTTVNIPITDANITDILPSNITNITVAANSPRFTCNTTGSTLKCTLAGSPLLTTDGWVNVATIIAKATTDFFDVSTNTPRDAAHNWITNQYQALTTLGDNKPADNAPGGGFLVTNTLIRAANMSIDKSGPATIGAGQSFVYTLDIKNSPKINDTNPFYNTPSTDAQTVKVTDRVPVGTTLNSASGNGWDCSGSTATVVQCIHNTDIAPGAVANSIDINVTAPNAITTLVNEANVTTVTSELTRLLPDNNDSVSTDVLGTNINVTKTGTTEAGMGDELTYTISVQNDSSIVPAKDVKIVDILHAGVTLDANWSRDITSDWSCVFNNVSPDRNISCDYNRGDLQPGAGNAISLTLYLKAPSYTGEIVNTAIATTTTPGDNTDTAQATTLITGANIDFDTVPFSQSPNRVGAYMPIDYNITVVNKGYSEATDVNLTMQFPTGFSQEFNVTSASGNGWGCNFDTDSVKLTCTLGTLAPNDTTSTVHISALAPNANQTVSYDIRVSAKDSENNVTSAVLTPAPTTIVKGSDLYIKKSAKDPDPLSDGLYHDDNITIGVGKQVDFNISVKNNNIGLAKDVTVTDTLAPEFVSDYNYTIVQQNDWNCSITGKTLSCNRAELAAKTTAPDIIVSAKTPSNLTPTSNTADTNTTTVEVNNSNNSDDVIIKPEGATLNAYLDVSKTQVALGEDFTYILDINNTGRNPAIDVNITDSLPTDLTYIDNNGSDADWNCTAIGNKILCTQPLIQAYSGESILKLNVKAPTNKNDTYSNSININSNSIKNPINTTAPDVRVVGADLNVSISATPGDILNDRNVTYIINVKDINISTAHDVVLKQTFLPAINALYITSGDSDCNLTDSNQSVTCNYSTLDYNQDKNITVIATMPDTNATIALTSTVNVITSTPQENLVDHNATVYVKVHPIIPVVNYRFEECKWNGTNGEVIDNVSGINGRAKNGAQTINHYSAYDKNNFSTAWRSGSFDGANDYISIPNNTLINTSSHNKRSISVWFKSILSNNKNQIIYEEGGGARGLALYVHNQQLHVSGWNKNESGWNKTDLKVNITENKWHHAVLVLDAIKNDTSVQTNAFKAYLDGVKFDQGSGSQLWPHGDAIGIGGVNGGTKITNHTNFKGNIDELEIYNLALDDKAVNDIYNFEKNHKNYDGTDRNETICGVDLKVIKTAIPSGDVGAESDLSYNITVTNLSNEPVTKGFTLSDSLPADVSYTSDTHSSNLSCTGTNDINCTFPNTLVMNKNDSETITVHTKTANVDKQNITNTATATPVQPDLNPNNNSYSASNRIIGTDLKITKTATPTRPNVGSPFIYTVTVENISHLADARNLVITDHYDDRLSYSIFHTSTTEANATIDCSTLSNHSVSCTANKLSKGNNIQVVLTMSSQNAATGLINEANVTSATKDTDLSNNSVRISTDTNNSASGVNIFRPSLKLFNNDVSANKYGNIATIGNTMLVPDNYTGTQKLNEINSLLVNSSSAELNIINTDDSNPDDNITIEYAGLFWGGHLHGNNKNETGNNIPFNSVDFTTPDGSVHNITVDKTDINGTIDLSNRADFYHFKKGDENNDTSNIGNYRIFYGAKADITDIIRGLNNSHLNGTYTVANMSVTSGIDGYDWAPSIKTDGNTTATSWTRFRNYGYFGGWSMVVAYSINHRYHRGIRFKNLSTFSGFVDLVPPGPGGQAKLPIDITGFITPIHGDIESSLYSFVQGGDRELSLENMTVKDKSGNENFVIEDTNNTTNIFNDSITLRDASGNFISKNPNVDYNVGNDIDQYNLNSKYNDSDNCINSDGKPCYLSNSQDDTNVTISVKEASTLDGTEYPSEQAFVQMLSMQTQIFTPDFIDSHKECFKLKSTISPQLGWVPCSNPSPLLRRGDTVKYRLTVINTGDDYAEDVYILDNLPKEVDYEENSSIVTHTLPFDELESNSPCNSSDYEHDKTVRDECSQHLKDLIENNASSPLTTVAPVDSNWIDNIDHNYNDLDYSDANNSLVYKFDTFPKDNVVWIEFNTTINGYAALGHTFKNKMSITFTNPTLADYNLSGGTVTQVSLPVESSPVTFNWDDINITVRDIGRPTVGAKVVNEPFDLNISLSPNSISDLDKGDANTSIFLNSLRIIDAYNSTNKNIYPTAVDSNTGVPLVISNTGVPLSTGIYTWLTHSTTYNLASRKLGFDMNISVKSSDGNYSVSKMFPQDFPNEYNASTPYTGDLFSTRPANFNISLTGVTPLGGYYIIKSGASNLGLNIHAPDYYSVNDSPSYNAALSKAAGDINISLDTTFPTTGTCIDTNEFNISTANFTNGFATANNAKYSNVGVVKVVLKDINWTAIDNNSNNDCNITTIGDNNITDTDGIISCSVDGNSTSIVFEPDHFTYTNTTVNDFNGGGFTYMVPTPISDPMFAKVTTTLEARNSDNNITSFFSNTCFGYDTNVQLSYDATSKGLGDLNISVANENNITNIASNSAIVTAGNNISTLAYKNQYASGAAPLTIRMAIDRNTTGLALQPALIDAQNLQGSITGYLGITGADVSAGLGTDINGTNNLHFLFGRVHAPDYRFAGNSGDAKIYYEAYCKDCNQTYRNNMNISNAESVDSVNWYINALHASLDGNVTHYSTIKDVKFGTNYATAIDDTNSTALGNMGNGFETLHVVTDPNNLPYIDKAEMSATDWLTYDPKDFILEFQRDLNDWAGQGKLGHIIDTNVSIRSNRRLNW